MLGRNLNLFLSLALVFVMLVAANFLSRTALDDVALDLTEDRLYTLSPGSKSLLGKLGEDVTVQIYYSRRAANGAPMIRQYADRVIALLDQCQKAADGKLTVEQIEPRPDTEEEEWAVKYGLQALPAAEPLYFGLVAISKTGTERALPFLDPQRESFLEYDIARLIDAVSNPERQKIGIMSSLPVTGGMPDDPIARLQQQQPGQAWAFVDELKQSYEVVDVANTASKIEDDIDLLLVIHPKNFSEQAQYAIDQYVVKGGDAMIFTDGHCENEMRSFRDPNPQARFQATFESNLPTLYSAWGIEQVPGKVIGDTTTGAMVNTGQAVKQHIVWLLLRKADFNPEELVTAGLEQVTIGSAGILRRKPDAPYKITPLIEAPATSMEVDSFMVKLGADPDQLAKDYKPGGEKLGIAMRIEGKFKTAFPGGKPASALPREPGEGETPDEEADRAAHVAEGENEARVIVVSDVDTLTDDFATRIQNLFGRRLVTIPYDNLNFALNAAEQLSGSGELAGLRTRGRSARPFTRVDRLEAAARDKYQLRETDLQRELEEANNRLSELQRGRGEGEDRAVLSAEQVAEVKKFQERRAEVMKELRQVRRDLRQSIEDLGTTLKLANVALMPLLMILLSFLPGMWRSYKVRVSRG